MFLFEEEPEMVTHRWRHNKRLSRPSGQFQDLSLITKITILGKFKILSEIQDPAIQLECLYVFDVFLLQINEYVLDSYRRQITFCIKRAIDFLRETHHIQYVLEGLSGH